MKKILAGLIILLTGIFAISSVNPTIIYANNDGYFFSSDINLVDSMAESTGFVKLVSAVQSDEIYESMGSTYINESKKAVDMTYPMYINNGASLKFFSDDFYIMTENFNVTSSYEALYVTNGNAYNEDFTLADGEMYYFVVLDNGLYMNTQELIFQSVNDYVQIPANSVIQFKEEGIKYYKYQYNELAYGESMGTFQAFVKIGGSLYDYNDFLTHLGIVREFIEDPETPVPTPVPTAFDKSESAGLNTETGSDVSGEKVDSEMGGASGGHSSAVEGDPSYGGGSDNDDGGGSSGHGQGGESGGDQGDFEGDYEFGTGSGNVEGDAGDGSTALPGTSAPTYNPPTISISNFDSWYYAVKADLVIKDYSGVLSKGITMSVYKGISGEEGGEKEVIDGVTVYSKDDYKGVSAALKSVFLQSGLATLSPLEPGETYYLQYTYIYTIKVADEETGEEFLTRTSDSSDIYEVATLDLVATDLVPIDMDYEVMFAEYPHMYSLKDMTFENYGESSDSTESETTETQKTTAELFEEFQQDTLPYLYQVHVFLNKATSTSDASPTPDKYDAKHVIYTSTITKGITTDGGVDYNSTNISLESNQLYSYTMVGYDKYGNIIPLYKDGNKTNTGYLYTAKDAPGADQTEFYNNEGVLQIKVNITDAQKTLLSENLKLQVVDSYGAVLDVIEGEWSKKPAGAEEYGDTLPLFLTESSDGLGNYAILDDAQDGDEYLLTVTSLPFSKRYEFRIIGGYDPKPDAGTGVVADLQEHNVILSSRSYFTAPLDSGNVYYTRSSQPVVNDTYGEFVYSTSKDCTFDILGMIDKTIIKVKDSKGNVVASETLTKAELDKITFDDLKEEGLMKDNEWFILPIAEGHDNNLQISLFCENTTVSYATSIWDALFMKEIESQSGGKSTYINGANIKIAVDKGTLETSTSYTISFENIVTKGGVEYYVPTFLDYKDFSTKKLEPIISTYEVFSANDFITLIDLAVYDIDQTILNDGLIQVQVCRDDIPLQVKTFNAIISNPQESDFGVIAPEGTAQISFSGLITDVEYQVKIVALSYNNDSGFANKVDNYVLDSFDIVVGRDITADITINNLGNEYFNPVHLSGEIDENIEDSYGLIPEYFIKNENTSTANIKEAIETQQGIIFSDNTATISGEYIKMALEDSIASANGRNSSSYYKWTQNNTTTITDGFYTEYFNIQSLVSEDANILDIISLHHEAQFAQDEINAGNQTQTQNNYIYFYDKNHTYITERSQSNWLDEVGAIIPKNAVYIRFLISGKEYLYENGIELTIYQAEYDSDVVVDITGNQAASDAAVGGEYITEDTIVESSGSLTSNTSYRTLTKLPVVEGEKYFVDTNGTTGRIIYFDENGRKIGYKDTGVYKQVVLTIPKDVCYISFYFYDSWYLKLVRVADAQPEDPVRYNQVENTDDVGVFSEYLKTLESPNSNQYKLGANSENTISWEYINGAISESENATRTGDYAWTKNGNVYTSEIFDITTLKNYNSLVRNFISFTHGEETNLDLSDTCKITFYREVNDDGAISYSEVSQISAKYIGDGVGGYIPSEATHMRISSTESLMQSGVNVSTFSIADDTPMITADQFNDYLLDGYGISSAGITEIKEGYVAVDKLPVVAGEIYFRGDFTSNLANKDGGTIYCFDENKNLISSASGKTAYSDVLYEIQDGVSYISYQVKKENEVNLYRVFDVSRQYNMNIDIDVTDIKGYLLDSNYASTTQLIIEESEIINEPNYQVVESKTLDIDLEKVYASTGEVASYSATIDDLNLYLKKNFAYKITIQGIFEGEPLVLRTLEIQTDANYHIVDTENEFYQMRNAPYDNYFITKDITIESYNTQEVYGIIDFGGNVLTSTNGTNYAFHTIGETGVIRNVLYDIPTDEKRYGLAYLNYGTIENFMVKTEQDITFKYDNSALVCYNNQGIIQNFIVELNGDIKMGDYNVSGIVSYTMQRNSVLQNGYIYSNNGAGLVYEGDNTAVAGLCCDFIAGAEINNVYTIYNTYNSSNTNNFSHVKTANGEINGLYHIGEYYAYLEDSDYKSTQRDASSRMIEARNVGSVEDVWHITGNEYSAYNTYSEQIQNSTVAILRDVDWQEQLLGDAFDVEGTVELGFYPRLNFPASMQKHQTYRYLPTVLTAETPSIVNDKLVKQNSNTIADIQIQIDSAEGLTLLDIDIPGLNTTIGTQEIDEGNLLTVNLSVSVATTLSSGEENPDLAYLSSYEVERMTFSNGGSFVSYEGDYETKSFEMFKEISTPEGWSNINLNMDWNYKLTNDINFSNSSLSTAEIMINGSQDSITKYTHFYGQIDGDGHTIKGINFDQKNVVNVIYYLNGSSSVRNLIVEDLTLHASISQSSASIGFIGGTSYDSKIENVHIKNASLKGSGYMGALVSLVRCEVNNCSAVDVYLEHENARNTLHMGGLIGYAEWAYINNCYVAGLDMVADNVIYNNGIGGCVGRFLYSRAENIYVQGDIISSSSMIGGFAGYSYHSYAMVSDIYTFVNIETSRDSVGGFVGFAESYWQGAVVMGDIISNGANTNRVYGMNGGSSPSYVYPVYASATQRVNDISQDSLGDATGFIQPEEFVQAKTWIDKVGFDSTNWDFSGLEDNFLPKLYNNETGELLPNQPNILAPGHQALQIEFASATMATTMDKFTASVHVSYAGLDNSELEALMKAGVVKIDIDGMNMATSTVKYVHGSDYLDVQIETTEYTKALDLYKCTLDFYDYEKNADGTYTIGSEVTDDGYCNINYGKAIYHEIATLQQWNDTMASHGYAFENIKIVGDIDFQNESVVGYTNLLLGSLIGPEGGKTIKNVNFNTTTNEMGSWILSAKLVENINFENMTLEHTAITTYSAQTCFIADISSGFNNINLTNISIKTLNSNSGSVAFVGTIKGSVDNVVVQTADIISTQTNTSVRYNAGSIAGLVNGTVSNIWGYDITINTPYSDRAGALFGYIDTPNSADIKINSNIHVAPAKEGAVIDEANPPTIEVTGRQYVGGIIGQSNSYQFENVSIEDFTVKGTYSAGGIFGYQYSTSSGMSHANLSVKNGSVTSTFVNTTAVYYTGGVAGLFYHTGTVNGAVIENVDILGTGSVGGFSGYKGSAALLDIQISDCTIESLGQSLIGVNSPSCGGVVGYDGYTNDIRDVVIKNTSITGTYNVGGITGVSSSRSIVRSSYIGEDVTIFGYNDNVGGILGSGYSFSLRTSGVGASVTGMGDNVGGIVGMVKERAEDTIYQYIRGVYMTGDISGANNVGGVIGSHKDGTIIDSADYTNVILSGNITGGTNVSPFIGEIVTRENVDYQGAQVKLWDESLYNGEKITDVSASKGWDNLYEGAVELISTQDFSDPDTYKDSACFAIETTNLGEDGNLYMPYITKYLSIDGNSGEILDNIGKDENGVVAVGDIKLPSVTEITETATTAVYASGLDSINIETTKDKVEVEIGGKTLIYNFSDGLIENTSEGSNISFSFANKFGERYNIVTIGYDFESTIKVDGKTYNASDLANKTLLHTSKWYVATGDGLHFGDKTGYSGAATLDGDVIHMWQGYILTDAGKVYDVATNTSITESSKVILSLGENINAARAVFTYGTIADQVNVYYNFSTIVGVYVPYRHIGAIGDGLIMYPAQKLSYDEFIAKKITANSSFVGIEESGDNRLIYNFGTVFEYGDVATANVAEMANTYASTGTFEVFLYNDGTFSVFDYTTGNVIYTTVPVATANFLEYASNALSSLLGEEESSNVVNDSSYIESSEMADSLNSENSGTTALPATATYSSTNGLSSTDGNSISLPATASYVQGVGVVMQGNVIYAEESSDESSDASSDTSSDTSLSESKDKTDEDIAESQTDEDKTDVDSSDKDSSKDESDDSTQSEEAQSGSSSGSSSGSTSDETAEEELDKKVELSLTEYGKSLNSGVYEVSYDAINREYKASVSDTFSRYNDTTSYEKVLENELAKRDFESGNMNINQFILTFNEKNGLSTLAVLIAIFFIVGIVVVRKVRKK